MFPRSYISLHLDLEDIDIAELSVADEPEAPCEQTSTSPGVEVN